MIKAALCLSRGFIPANLHFERLNPHIAIANTALALASEGARWESQGLPRCAGVSSFSFGGTNAHVIMEEAPERAAAAPAIEEPHVLPISARSAQALEALAERFQALLADSGAQISLKDLAYTAGVRRRHHDHRIAVVGQSRAEWVLALKAAKSGEELPSRGPSRASAGVVFVYSGQGPQWLGVGKELYDREPAFREAFDNCDAILAGLANWSLREVLSSDLEARTTNNELAQPAIFALQVGLTALWRSWGIVPEAVIGHSVGEVAAAYGAGVLGLEDAVRVIFHRNRLMQRATGLGRMAAVGISGDEAHRLIGGRDNLLSVGAINSPVSSVLSGDAGVLTQVLGNLEARGVIARLLDVDYAFHSAQMNPFCDELTAALAGIVVRPSVIPLISTVSGKPASEDDFGPEYWARNIRQTVLFGAGIEHLLAQDRSVFLEISPQPILGSYILQCRHSEPSAAGRPEPAAQPTVLASLRRGRSERETLLKALGELYVAGYPVDWQKQHPSGGQCIPLPDYPWQRKRHWLEAPAVAATSAPEPGDDTSSWFYDVEWELRSRFVPDSPPRRAASFAAPEEIAARVSPRVDAVSTGYGVARLGGPLKQLDDACREYAVAAFTELGLSFSAGARWSFDSLESLAGQLGVRSQHARLLGRLTEMCETDGVVARDRSGWTVLNEPVAADPSRRLARLGNQYPELQALFRLVERCGMHLAQVLRGDLGPLPLLFSDDPASSAERIYHDVPFAKAANSLLAETIEQALANRPASATLRILEIGAGTGGITKSIVGRLPARQVEYVFTDVSTMFLERARDTFRDDPFMRYSLLDIEHPEEAIGKSDLISAGGFDLILAANVLHATADLHRTLSNVRHLLAPSGMLLLLEATAPRRWLDLTFGLTDGWSKFNDQHVRPDYPLLAPESWLPALSKAGFPETAVVPCDVDGASALFQQAILIGRASNAAAAARVDDDRSKFATRSGAATKRRNGANRTELPSSPSESWLILADGRGTGERMAALIEAAGGRCVLAEPGTRFDALSACRYRIHPANPDDYRRLVKEALGLGSPALHAVVHLFSCDISEPKSAPEWESAQALSCGSALYLTQALAQAAVRPNKGLWLVTRGAQSVAEDVAAPAIAQAPLWGFGRSFGGLRQLRLWGGMIDLSPDRHDHDAARLLMEIATPDGEDQIALRGDRYVCRLAPSKPPPEKTVTLNGGGAYLITGGLGGLGTKIARWMVERGARHLVLLGRRGIPERSLWSDLPVESHAHRVVAAIQAIERMGATVEVVAADVADRAAIEAVVHDFGKSRPPLRGVVHAASAWSWRPLLEMPWETLDGMLRAKSIGTWNLHELTRECPLDFFALFSSTASLLGGQKLAHYAAANAFLDTFAQYRRVLGLPVVSINWGTWNELRQFSRADQNDLARLGLEPMPSERALAAFGRLLAAGET